MKAMILAAGRGQRMGILTEQCPKPLLQIGGDSLIGWQIRRLAQAGIDDIVINVAYKAEMIIASLGNGHRFGVNIVYSPETGQGLETAGGILQALPLLGDAPFLVINADVWHTLDIHHFIAAYPSQMLAHLLLVDTPTWKENGDFSLENKMVTLGKTLTFAGISVLHPALFTGLTPGFRPLAPLLRRYIAQKKVSGQYFPGLWCDVGTPQRLAELRRLYI